MRLSTSLCRSPILRSIRSCSKMADGMDVYTKAENYWSSVASDVDGMLGGFEQLHQPDINTSKQFLMDLKKRGYLSTFGTALDCGSGIGRITKHLLLPLFSSVDMLDVTEKFIEDSAKYIGQSDSKVGNKFVEGLQTFVPESRHYDVIWIQWVIGHLTDEDCVNFLKRCKEGLTENGLIVLKDNHASGDKRDFDETDYSWTRIKGEYLSLFQQAGLKIVSDRKQTHFPKGMYEVRMYGLKASGRMIASLKKKLGSGAPVGSNNRVGHNAIRTGGVVPINTELQKKFAHGVNFNMKIIIKGDRASGKTCLFRRLQGQQFNENYVPTEEIQVANVLWNYRTSDHIVKLDVWDVCDVSTRRTTKKVDGLKLDNNSQPSTSVDPDLMICDATFIDVYKNCTGVLLIFDVTKAWTWKYVCKELEHIPSVIPVLVLANKADLDKQREVFDEEVLTFLTNYKRRNTPNNRLKAPIRFTTCSTRTAHGLKYIYNFLNIPFLFLQREYLENSLEANGREIDVAQDELDCYEGNSESPTFSHGVYQKVLAKKEESEPTNQTNGNVQKKRHSRSSASGDDNPVNMYEEDFDSNDECHRTLDAYVAKTASAVSPEQQTFTSFNEILESSASIIDQLSLGSNTESVVQQTESTPNDEVAEERLDSWLDELESKPSALEEKSAHVSRRLSSTSSNESGQNPLVTKFEDAEDSDNDSQVQSNYHGSVSCSTTGFTVVRPPKSPKTAWKHPTLKTSSALEDFLAPEQSPKLRESKPKPKKKTKKASDKSSKKKPSKRNDVSNILVEDEQPIEIGNEQYDPI